MLSVALAGTALCATAPAARATIGAQQIDAFLLAHDSPLAGEGAAFYAAGRRNGVDPAFLVAISGAESSFGQYLFSAGSQTASHNAFNWFFAPTRAGSAFTSWDQAIATVAVGLRGPLYYGAGRYAVGAIAPIYCPQGTQAWIDNVTACMLYLGADPSDTRWPGAAPAGTSPAGPSATGTGPAGVTATARDELRIFAATDAASALVVTRPIALWPATVVAGTVVRIRFTLTNPGHTKGHWQTVILRLQGPSGQALAFGSRPPLQLAAGASYSFQATTRLSAAGAWRGWVDVEAPDGAILTARRPALHLAVARAATRPRRPRSGA